MTAAEIPAITERVRLRAADTEDLAIIAACLQGAMGCYGEMAFDEPEQRFAAIMVRYTWEDAAAHDLPAEPVPLGQLRTALRIEAVDAVRLRGIDRAQPNKLLEVLTLSARELDGRVMVHLIFAGGGEVCIEAVRLDVRLEDLDEPVESGMKAGFASDAE